MDKCIEKKSAMYGFTGRTTVHLNNKTLINTDRQIKSSPVLKTTLTYNGMVITTN